MSDNENSTENVVAELRRRAVRRNWTGDPIDGGVGWVEHSDPFLVSAAALIESQRATIERVEREAAENASREFMWRDQLRAAEARVTALEAAIEALEQCEEYFDNRADADCEGDPAEFVPNKEMRLLSIVRDALAAFTAPGHGDADNEK